MITAQSSMEDILEGMVRAEPYACEAYVENLDIGEVNGMIGRMDALGEHVWKAQMRQPGQLMAYKFPSEHEPLPANISQLVLDPAIIEDDTAISDTLTPLSFENLATISSLSHLIRDAAARRQQRTVGRVRQNE